MFKRFFRAAYRRLFLENRRYWAFRGISVGVRTHIARQSRIVLRDGASVKIGDEVGIDAGIDLNCLNGGIVFIQDRVQIRAHSFIYADHGTVTIGENSYLNVGCYISAGEGVTIGKNVLLGPYCVIIDSQYNFKSYSADNKNATLQSEGNVCAPIFIGDGAGLGAHVAVMRGVTIGKGAVIAVNSVVTKDIPDYAIAGGSPARVIGYRSLSD